MNLDDDTRALLEAMRAIGAPPLHELPLADARLALAAMSVQHAGEPVAVAQTEDLDVAGVEGPVPVRLYRPPATSTEPPGMLVLYHGGGFCLGDIDTHDPIARYLCANAGVLVANVGYRLAPEHPFPAGVEDAYAALVALAGCAGDLGGDPARLAVLGDSAGANISAVTCLLARDRHGPALALQVLAYPAVDMDPDASYPSREAYGGGEYFLSVADMQWLTRMYLGEGMPGLREPRCSPILAEDLAGLPPALVLTAGFDPLLDEGRDFAERLRAAGVPVEYQCFEGTVHGFLSFPGTLSAAREGLALIAGHVRRALGG